jgi:dTDP-4-dehydrorhamnose reductase
VRILVFGGWGQLGTDLALAAEGRHQLVRPHRAEVDVTNAAAVAEALGRSRPDAVVNAAAFHRVELCEAQPGTAMSVNAVGALTVARAARAVGARTIYVSTDYVFGGENPDGYEEDAPMRPLSVYGVSKAAGERLVRLADHQALVVRVSGLFGHAGSSGKGGNFVETMLTKAAAGEHISVVDDQWFAPTSAADAAERILGLLQADAAPGVYHLANAGSCSWFEFAREVFAAAGIQADLAPRASGEQAVRRPRWSILLDRRTEGAGLPPARDWREALAGYVRARPERMPAGATIVAPRSG